MEVLYIKSCSKKFLQYSQENTCVLPPFNKVAALKASCFIKIRFQQRCFTVNITKYLRTPILKNSCKQLFLYIVSKLEKWEMENSSKQWPCLLNIQKQPFRGAQKDTNPKYFFKFQENISWKVLEHLWMATFGDSVDKILLFNNNRPPESNRMLFWKNMLTKRHLL